MTTLLAKQSKKQQNRERKRATQQHKLQVERDKRSSFRHQVAFKRTVGQQIADTVPELSEQELEQMYKGLMTATPEQINQAQHQLEPAPSSEPRALLEDGTWTREATQTRQDRLNKLYQRLLQLERGESEQETDYHDVANEHLASSEQPTETALVSASPTQLLDKVISLHSAQGHVAEADSPSSSDVRIEEQAYVPRGLLTRSEWQDLVLACAESDDIANVTKALAAMQRLVPLSNGDLLTKLLSKCAQEGRPRDAMALTKFANDNRLPMSIVAHHHVLMSLLPLSPELALKHLHQLEAAHYTPLLESYTAVISHLLSPTSPPHLVSRGWDLFAHTRLVSHPTPSVELYTTMIQACATSAYPSPERALDLFHEMTIDNKLIPTEKTFNNVIKTCCRQGSLNQYFEGLRLMKQMLNDNVEPSRYTFNALLEGSRRHGDLARARWMLVRMCAIAHDNVKPDSNTLGLVFQTYATYQPPVRQIGRLTTNTNTKQQQEPQGTTIAQSVESSKEDDNMASSIPSVDQETPLLPSTKDVIRLFQNDSIVADLTYPGPLPQTTVELVNEAWTLLSQCVDRRILRVDAKHDDGCNQPFETNPSFSRVIPTPFLLNSFQSVLESHAPFNDVVEFYDMAWTRLNVSRNRFTFEQMMERCETAKNRDKGLEVARRVFQDWQSWFKQQQQQQQQQQAQVDEFSNRNDARSQPESQESPSALVGASDATRHRIVTNGFNVSKMWASMIRNLARCFKLDEAKSLLNEFHRLYPPSTIVAKAYAQQLEMSSPLSTMKGSNSKQIRLGSPLYPETFVGSISQQQQTDFVSPFLLMQHLRVFQLRLANIEDQRGLELLKRVCQEYEKAVKIAKAIREGTKIDDADVE
ncbi:hypothetical protein OIO90_000608 [Microbotryomycetes sp. JL221]|nr:hypothetical protein OIO90_000608 [Microbotryomycetes sp. JL221]